MKILGIETSCDETAAAIIKDGNQILSNVVSSSKEIHNKTGGVIPEVAAREQLKWMIPVLSESLFKSNLNINDLDAIAVTIGPGLIGSLLVGVETAKTIAFVTGKPIIPVNHILAHIYANFLEINKEIIFPAIALVVSGGHTELFFMKDRSSFQWIGGTLDDAAGEAFDKTARLLELGYPGGPVISAAAEKFKRQNVKSAIRFPRPMISSGDLNFSFSGLKSAVMREVKKLKESNQFNPITINQLSYEIQEAITEVLVKKTLYASQNNDVKSILLGGGVAANIRLKEKFQIEIGNLKLDTDLHIPQPNYCTDNGAAIASYAYFHNHPEPWKNIEARPDLEVEVE